MPHRMLRTELVDELERAGARARGLAAASGARREFKKMSRHDLARAWLRDGLAMQQAARTLSWSQMMLAANTPMLLRAGLVEGAPTPA